MSERQISEKALEILFNRFLLQSFPLGAVQLFAPTTVEEFRSGYDSRVVGFASLRELYLQFKAPSLSTRDRFTLTPTPHQHKLLKAYPPRTAYYVTPTFRSLAELNSAQRDLATAADFLRHFICIEASALPSEISFLHYLKPANHRESPQIRFKTPSDGTTRTAKHPVHSEWLQSGKALLDKFKRGDAGAKVELPTGFDLASVSLTFDGPGRKVLDAAPQHSPEEFGGSVVSGDRIVAAASGLSRAEFGVLVRMQI